MTNETTLQAPSPERAEDIDGVPPAAALSATMVHRGRNPWWGKDQKPAPDAKPAPRQPHPAASGASIARARVLLDQGDVRASDNDVTQDRRVHPRPPRAGFSTRTPLDDQGPALLDRLPGGWLKDIVVFTAVFAVSCALMLYLALRAL